MEYVRKKELLPKSKSLLCLQDIDSNFGNGRRHRTYSDSSADVCFVLSDDDCEDKRVMDRGFGDHTLTEGDILASLEQKIDKLSETVLEQCSMLNSLKQELRNSKMVIEEMERSHNQVLLDLLKDIAQRLNTAGSGSAEDTEEGVANSSAKSLLSAIQPRERSFLDNEIRSSLVKFLQSNELKEQMVQATVDSVKDMIHCCINRDVCAMYTPVLERAHLRHIAHVETVVQHAFAELEEKSSRLFKTVYKTSGALRRALERHQDLLEAASHPGNYVIDTFKYAVEEVLQKELSEWREKVADMWKAQVEWPEPWPPEEPTVASVTPKIHPLSPKTETEASAIDRLMEKAFIHKKIQDGDVNGSFSHALSAGDLSLVMTACRCADPAVIFAPPCSLQPPVLLSLVQQLATDMLQDTSLKCRYLEEAVKNLDTDSPSTRVHLPLVVGQLRSHLNRFLTTYPNHVASGKITLIIAAADNLLK